MNFQYSFELTSCIFLIIFLIDFLYKRQLPRNTTRVFLPFLLISILSSLTGIFTALVLNDPDSYSLVLKYSLSVFYYFTQGISCFLFFLFTSAVSGNLYHRKWVEPVFFWFPAFVYCILSLTAPLNHIFFYFTEGGRYQYGISEDFLLIMLLLFFVIHSYHVLRYGDKDKLYARTVILVFCLCAVSCAAIQAIIPTLLLLGFARAITFSIMYISLQNPNELLDGSTDLFNKTAFYLSVKEKEKNKETYSVIYLNIDKYRFINQNFGYENATTLLIDIANELKNLCPTNEIYRMDRDEFALITYKHEELNYISAIKERFEKPWFIIGTAVMLNARLIVLRYPEHFEDATELIPMLLYMDQLAKKHGDGALFMADEESVFAFRRHVYIEDAIKEALANHTICAFFQPIHSARDHHLVSAEVLARIPDEKFGFIPTQEFIGIAENNGFIVELGYRIFEEACAFLKKLAENGDSRSIHSLEVNISAIQCFQPDLADQMISIAERYGIRPSSINFEITETAAIQSELLLHRHMQKLHDKGFTFSLDDYGTGYANCSYLISYPFDQIKFDRSMILSYFSDSNAKLIMDNEFDTIRRLGKSIVAEGVETPEQAAILTAQGIDFIQGHYFSEPLTELEFMNYLASK